VSLLQLVNPFLDRNVGSVARSMLNFGLKDLVLVDPQCDHLSQDAVTLAAGAESLLRQAAVVPQVLASWLCCRCLLPCLPLHHRATPRVPPLPGATAEREAATVRQQPSQILAAPSRSAPAHLCVLAPAHLCVLARR